jgi:RNA polymerase sigma-70 factor (ECF subfamily)
MVAVDLSVRQAMLDAIPHLRAFAISLSGNITYADDLVQGALMRGLEKLDKFQPGTNMQAWLFTILRNQFYTDMQAALARLSVEQREALLLVAAEGLSYEEAAQICGTNLGTIKSRINRARTRLAELLDLVPDEDLGPDRLVQATLFMHASM